MALKYVCESGRTYLLVGNEASPCFNGAGFTVLFNTIEDIEKFDEKLKWDNISGQYN